LRLHYPGVVTTKSGERIPAQSWKHYSLSTDLAHGDAQGAVWSDFWVSFCITLVFVLFSNNFIVNILKFDIAETIPFD